MVETDGVVISQQKEQQKNEKSSSCLRVLEENGVPKAFLVTKERRATAEGSGHPDYQDNRYLSV